MRTGTTRFPCQAVPAAAVWIEAGARAVVDTVFIVGSTGMAVGGLAALLLDNTIPGSREERGLAEWERVAEADAEFRTFREHWLGSRDD